MYAEDDLLPISALAHLQFCPRRCALVHLEGIWAENAQTAEGRVLHQRVHETSGEMDGPVRVARGLRLASRTWGLYGVADVVEFRPVSDSEPGGAVLPGRTGRWQPFPVEYKRGRRKPELSYFVQLCAQGLCLEEALGVSVPGGALYHGQSRRRQDVAFDSSLRERTQALAGELHRLLAGRVLPGAEPGAKCRYCSLADRCMPKLVASRSARHYLASTIQDLLAE